MNSIQKILPRALSSNTSGAIALQLDYYMSSQFAGIACALTNNLYEQSGIDLSFLPTCPVGLEQQRVREHSNKTHDSGTVTIGSVEQNIFVPTLYSNPELKVKAVSAIFRRSPLCLASLNNTIENKASIVVGAHEDTVSLLQHILPSSKYSVISSPRAIKITHLRSGELDAIQAYTTTEIPTLKRQLGKSPIVDELEGMNGAKLGYSQVLFTSEEALGCPDRREVVSSFLDATFRGWEMAIRDPELGARSVEEAKSMLDLDDEGNDHWDSSPSYRMESVGLCNNFVKETFEGDRLGVIDATRWNKATHWLLTNVSGVSSGDIQSNFGLEDSLWKPSS